MTDLRADELVKLADELESSIDHINGYRGEIGIWPDASCMALGEVVAKNSSTILTALRRLAEAGMQEAVAWRYTTTNDQEWRASTTQPVQTERTALDKIEPLYTAPPALAAAAVKVKALEWTGRNADGSIHIAYDGPVQYWAWELAGFEYWSWGALSGREAHGGIEAAKAAAQADYDSRIRSALEEAPASPTPGDVLPRILKILNDNHADDLLQTIRDLIEAGVDDCLSSADIIAGIELSMHTAALAANQSDGGVEGHADFNVGRSPRASQTGRELGEAGIKPGPSDALVPTLVDDPNSASGKRVEYRPSDPQPSPYQGEVRVEELARWLGINASIVVNAVLSPANDEAMIPLARALLSAYRVGKR